VLNVVTTTLVDGVAIVTLDNPPINSLGHSLRDRLVQQIGRLQADPAVHGIVLTGSERAFSAGADVSEFGTVLQFREPILRTVIARIEASAKPIVAAISGAAIGGGLEIALACHGRVAESSARVGLPEISLGLIPGAGGTQRLPRLVGPALAFALMASGQTTTVSELATSGLFDVVTSDHRCVQAAIDRAKALVHQGRPYPSARDGRLEPTVVEAEVARQHTLLNARQRLQPAYGALLDAMAASALPFDEGLRKERRLFLDLLETTAAQALRYQFKAEREAAKPPTHLPQARQVQRIAVIGAGTMGSGITIAALDSGKSVLLLEQNETALARGRERIREYYSSRVKAGKLDQQQAFDSESRLTSTLDWKRLGSVDIVIEAVFEDLAVKQEVFRILDANAPPGAILATNTSYLDIDAIAAATSRPQDVLGLHFFSPAHVMKLLEVVQGKATAPDVVATGMSVGKALRKTPVLAGNAFGFIGNRIYNAYRRQCEFMLEDGAWPEDVDAALTAFGFAMGPFAVADLSGLDIAWRMRKAQTSQRDPRERYVAILDELCELGRLGRKTGAGYYTYVDGKQASTTDPTVRLVIERASARRGIERKALSPELIQRRALLAMVNEAALLLDAGIAVRPSDVDVVLVQGYGFPRWAGGPVFWARRQDQGRLQSELAQLAEDAGFGSVPASLDPIFKTDRQAGDQ